MAEQITEQFSFRPKARLLLQLGDQLIRNEAVALFELAKNSYDANASHVKISFLDIDNPDIGKIVIEDDGDGMNLDIIKNVWMQPGTDHKVRVLEEQKHKSLRLPIGEKGIGRFGAYKLGNRIDLISKKENCPEVNLSLDWNILDNSSFLDGIQVDVFERTAEHFTGQKTGTIITISDLKTTWTKRNFRETMRLINTLNTPSVIKSNDSFSVILFDNLDWSEDLMVHGDILDYALYTGEFELEGDKLASFRYNFTPWSSMKELTNRKHEKNDIWMAEQVRNEDTGRKEFVPIDLGKYQIGKVRILIYAFSLDSGILKLGVSDKSGFKKYLEQNGGMRVYRDGMRIYDYGEKTNDWLNLNLRRVNRPGKFMSRNLFMGYVLIDRADSDDLQEKANREGFVENDAYEAFHSAILFSLDQFEVQRNIDKDRLNNYYLGKQKPIPVITRLSDLKDKVINYVADDKSRDELLSDISRVENEYDQIMDTFIKSANAGINLGTIIHEVDKIIFELDRVLQQNSESQRAKILVARLSHIVKGYSVLLRSKDKKAINVESLINEALFNMEFRMEAHKITVIKDFPTLEGPDIVCARGLVIGAILNIIDNSIWWLGYSRTPEKKIHISISDRREGYLTVIISDNGPGFDLPEEERIKPFVSSKPAGLGMGLGLYIVNECMDAQGGDLLFPDAAEYSIPSEFEHGAIVALSFRKGMNL